MWDEGYVSDIDYTQGFYSAMSPRNLFMALRLHRVRGRSNEDLSYLELGFGQGITLNLLAACNPGAFWGTDFNPGHAANAQELANASSANTNILELSFAELAGRQDLPQFDIIALHGIWSWVTVENRNHIVEIARRFLKPGGIFYLSYNVTPGNSPLVPLRNLLKQHVELNGGQSTPSNIKAAVEFAQSIVDCNARYFNNNTQVANHFDRIKKSAPNYLAHEFLNDIWEPMPFNAVADVLKNGKLSFAAPAQLLDRLHNLNLTSDWRKLLAGIDNPILRETVRDFVINQSFRKDIFIKGHRRTTNNEYIQDMVVQNFTLIDDPNNFTGKVKGALGEVELSRELFDPVLEALSKTSTQSMNFGQLSRDPACKQLSFEQLVNSLTILSENRMAAATQSDEAIEKTRATSLTLNQELCRRAEIGEAVPVLASPVIGTGMAVNPVEQLFIRGKNINATDIPAFAIQKLQSQGKSVMVDGKPTNDPNQAKQVIAERFNTFHTNRLPLLQRLGVCRSE